MPSRMKVIVREHRSILVGLKEISELAGVSRQQAAHMVRYWWFPDPVDFLACGTVWDYGDVIEALTAKGYPKKKGKKRPLKHVKAPAA